MKKIFKILIILCIVSILIVFCANILYKNHLIKELDLPKDFLDYTFQSNNWQILKLKRTDYLLPSLNEFEYTVYPIYYRDYENNLRHISDASSLSEDIIEDEINNILNEQLEIEKNIEDITGPLKYYCDISTSINFEDDVNIMNATNGVKLYNIYDFLAEQRKQNKEITISTDIVIDDENKDKLLLEKDNLAKKFQETLYKKTGYSIPFIINISEASPYFI